MTERESCVHTQEKLHARMVPLLFTNKYRLVKSCFVSVLGKVNVGDRQCHLLHTIMLIQSVRIISNTNCQPNIEELLLPAATTRLHFTGVTTFTDTIPTTITATATTSLVGFLLLLQSSAGDYNDENHRSSVSCRRERRLPIISV